MKKVVIVGGGLAGLIAAHGLAKQKISCILLEKKEYPFHRVCGEYISEETVSCLESLKLFPSDFNPPRIRRLQLTSVNGKSAILPLDLGGFGISRYCFDNFLVQKLEGTSVSLQQNTEVEQIHFRNDHFVIKTNAEEFLADVVIGSFGKRSKLDAALHRDFMKRKSPYVGVKYHIRTDHPADLIALHNFKDGYCGLSNIEEGKSNLCYLTHRNNLKKAGSIKEMEESILYRNPFLRKIFTHSEFLFEKPETINEISFATKSPVENHLLMCGDSAGMITPLCGNGMAIAIHSAKIATELVSAFCENKISRSEMENQYAKIWKANFSSRLWAGRQIQNLFGSEAASNIAVNLALHARPIAHFLISKTHGNSF